MTGWHVFRKESYQPRCVVLLMALALCGRPLFAVEANAPSGPARNAVAGEARQHEVIPLTNISPERAKEFLNRLKIGTASRLPNTNRLLVTAEPGELRKAVILLNLVDTRTEFDIKELVPASGKAPSNVQIATAVGGLTIGTFAHPPQDTGKMRAIVDVHNGKLVAIAPAFQLDDIKLAAEMGPDALKQKKANLLTPIIRPASLAVDERQTAVSASSPSGTPNAGSGRLTEESPNGDLSALGLELRTSAFNLQAANNEQPGRLTQAKETQLNREQTGELQTQRTSLSQSNTKPEQAAPAEPPHAAGNAPAGQSAAKPEQAAPADRPQADSKPVAGQSNTLTAEPAQPAKPQETAQNRPESTPAQPSGPAPAPSASLQPGPAVPTTPAPTTPKQNTTVASPLPPLTTPITAASAAPRAEVLPSAYQPLETANGDEVLDLKLQERMSVILLLDLVGKYLGLSYVYNPEEVKGEVSLKLNGDLHGKVRVKDLYPLLEQSLRQNNLVTTRHKGNVVSIVPAARIADIDPILFDPKTARVETGDTAVRSKFELKYIDTVAAKNLLDNMKLAFDVTAIPEKHMLLVTTYAYRMERVEQLLQLIDQPGEPKKFRFRQLRYTMAKTLADKVKAMAEQMLEMVSVTVAESDPAANVARTPGESDIAYRTRLAQVRAQQTALRATQQIARAQLGQETKPTVYLDADERTNRVLMIGAEKQLGILEQLVDALDVEQQDLRALQLYRMKHVDAEEVARKLHELGIISKLPDGSTASRYPTTPARITPQLPGQPRPATPQAPEPQVAPTTEVTEKGLVEEPQVVVVEATNSLLVNATAEQHAKITRIIEYVDSETLTDEIPYKIYPLENSSPKHLAEVLQNLIQETVEQQKEGGKIEKVVVNKDEKIKIVPDPNTYSLIVYANKKNQEWISTLVSQLDKRRPQVLIDVTLVAIQKHDKFDMEINLLRSSPDIAGTSGVTGATTDKMLGRAFQTSGGGATVFYGDKQVQALLDTVQEKTYGRVLAKPKLLVNDNEKGKLDAKDTTYVEITSTMPVASGVPGQATGVVQSSTNFNAYDAGVMLDITPHISEGDLLRLDIKLTRSDFTKILATKPPDKKSSEVDTAVTLPNGATVILGGLVKLNQNKGGSKVPFLGDIPILGGLFRSIHNSEEGEYLYMFVKAEIIRPDDSSAHGMKGLEKISQSHREAFEKRELEYQTYQDWPGIKSKRVEPSKVLDAQ